MSVTHVFENITNYVDYTDNFLPRKLEKNILQRLFDNVDWLAPEETTLQMFGREIQIPRSYAVYGESGTSYYFSGKTFVAKDWSKVQVIKEISNYVKKILDIPFNYVLVNLYRDGNQYIGAHSDNEKTIDQSHPIVSLSFGAERRFYLHKNGKIEHKMILKHNSCVIMQPGCQKEYKHSVPKQTGVKEPRINMTFRVVK